MKITAVETILLSRPLRSTMRISRGGFTVREHLIVRVTTDEGFEGLGEGVGNARLVRAIVDGWMGAQALGLDPTCLEGVRRRLLESQVYYERGGSVTCAASALETACWDIRARALGKPLCELLGGRLRERLPVYASDVYWEEDPAAVAANARRIADLGVRTIKAHLGAAPPEEDLRRVRALREAVGSDVGLMIDLNAGYDPLQAQRAVTLWEPYGLLWLEEPVHPAAVEAMARLRERGSIPLAAGENDFRVEGFQGLFQRGAVDVAMPDIGRVGGIEEARRVCALAEAFGVAVSPHNFSSGVLLAATMHLMAAMPNTTLLEFDTSGNAVYEEFFPEPLELRDGAVRVPSLPGLGITLNEAVLKHRIP